MNYLDRANELRKQRSKQERMRDENLIAPNKSQLDGVSWHTRAMMVLNAVALDEVITGTQLSGRCMRPDNPLKYKLYAAKLNGYLHSYNRHIKQQGKTFTLVIWED